MRREAKGGGCECEERSEGLGQVSRWDCGSSQPNREQMPGVSPIRTTISFCCGAGLVVKRIGLEDGIVLPFSSLSLTSSPHWVDHGQVGRLLGAVTLTAAGQLSVQPSRSAGSWFSLCIWTCTAAGESTRGNVSSHSLIHLSFCPLW